MWEGIQDWLQTEDVWLKLMISHIGMQKNPWKDLTVLWIDEGLQIETIMTGGFVLKDNSILDEEEYILKIAVEILHPTVQV